MNGIQRAIAAAGSQRALASALGVSQQFVNNMSKEGRAPVLRAKQIEELYGIDLKDLV